VDWDSLIREIESTQNSFYALGGDHVKDIGKLQKLYLMVKEKILERNQRGEQPLEQGEMLKAENSEGGASFSSGVSGTNLVGGSDFNNSFSDFKPES
jgi:hypothetical protein